MTLGEKLKAVRLERHMTQKQVAGTRITRNMLSEIENGSAVPSVKTLEYLADVLGVSAGYFMDDSEASVTGPDNLVNARAAFQAGEYEACLQLLKDMEEPAEQRLLQIYEMLEQCYRELEDYKGAYQYASLQLKLRK